MQAGLRRWLLAAIGAVAIAATVAGVAFAAASAPVAGGPAGAGVCATEATAARSSGTVAAMRVFANCEIGRRLTTLGQVSSALGASKGFTSSDRAALASMIAADSAGLTSLKAAIDGQTSIAALKLQVVAIVARYRVYVLLGPQVRLTIAADDVLALKPHFDQVSTALAARIAQARANGRDVSAAQADLGAMNSSVAAAVALAAPLPARLLALTPAQFNAGTASPVLQSVRAAVLKARDDLVTASQDGRKVLADLA